MQQPGMPSAAQLAQLLLSCSALHACEHAAALRVAGVSLVA